MELSTFNGSIFVPSLLTKRGLMARTGIDLVCGPDGENRACYCNDKELEQGDALPTANGGPLSFWLDVRTPRLHVAETADCLSLGYAGHALATGSNGSVMMLPEGSNAPSLG